MIKFFTKPTGITLPGIKKTIYPLEWSPDEPGALTKWRRYVYYCLNGSNRIGETFEHAKDREQYYLNVEAETGIKH